MISQRKNEEQKQLPISEYQKRFFMEWALNPKRTDYNSVLVYEIGPELNKRNFVKACEYFLDNNELAYAQYSSCGKYCFYKDYNINDFYSEKELNDNQAVEKYINKLVKIPFDLTSDALINFHLIYIMPPSFQTDLLSLRFQIA